jgi:hypothetical protein
MSAGVSVTENPIKLGRACGAHIRTWASRARVGNISATVVQEELVRLVPLQMILTFKKRFLGLVRSAQTALSIFDKCSKNPSDQQNISRSPPWKPVQGHVEPETSQGNLPGTLRNRDYIYGCNGQSTSPVIASALPLYGTLQTH